MDRSALRAAFAAARERSSSIETRILVVLAVLAGVVVIGQDPGVLTPDTKPEIFLAPGQTAARFATSWLDTPNLGAANYNTGVAPIAALLAVPEALGVPPWLIGRLWRLSLILLAAAGARLVVRDLLGPRASGTSLAAGGVLAAVAYAANPYVVVGGGTTPTMLPYALLPWLVLCWLRGARAPSWRWAAAAALVLAAMSGLNAGVVPIIQLVVIVPVALHVLYVERRSWLTFAWLVARTGALYAVLSLYWLVPAVSALGVGASVAEATESTEAIHSVSSFAEVIRGLGMWTLYGADSSGPFDPGRLDYVTSSLVVLLTFGWVVVAGLAVRISPSPGRLFGAAALLVGGLVMVGTFPERGATAWSSSVGWALDEIPGLIAFRTTNKAGAVLELGIAVLVGLAAAQVVPRLRSGASGWTAGLTATAVAAGAVAPALMGNLFWVRMDVPSYWDDAAAQVNARPGHGRVLMVPGTGVPEYSWGYEGPDEIGPSLFDRPFVFRSASPSGGEYAANLLGGVDLRLQQGTAPAGSVSALSRYIGASDVVARYDGRQVPGIGARVEEQLQRDEGLGRPAGFGPVEAGQGAPSAAVVRGLTGPSPTSSAGVRVGAGALVVDGAGTALPGLQAAGLLDGTPALLLAGGLDDDQLQTALRDGARVVLTDSNGRREWSNHDPSSVGPLLGPDDEVSATRALFGPENQTVALLRGSTTVTTTGEPSLFGEPPYAGASQAFDGDLTTGWRFGAFGTGAGHAITLTPRTATEVPEVTLRPMQGAGSRITTVDVTSVVNGQTTTEQAELSEWSSLPTTVALPRGQLSSLTITVTGVAGDSGAPVGFTEISAPELTVDRVAALPTALSDRLRAAAAGAGRDLADVPVDVIMRRGTGDVNGIMVEEATLEREVDLPDERAYEISGTLRFGGGAPDPAIDALAGRTEVVADSSSRLYTAPKFRASAALDDRGDEPDLETAWVPGGTGVGEWISVDFPERDISSFSLTQGKGSHVSRALVSLDDGEPFEVALEPGRTIVELPEKSRASRVRLMIAEVNGPGQVSISDLGLPRQTAVDEATGCTTVARIDGEPVRADLSGDVNDLLAGRAVPFTSCDEDIWLGHQKHRISGEAPFAVDDLRLRSATSDPSPNRASTAPEVEVTNLGGTSIEMRFLADCHGCLVSSGQAYDPRWQARLGENDLGAPIVVDAYASGWRVDAAAGDVVHVSFGPGRAALLGWLASGLGLLACLTMVLVPAAIRRWGRAR